MPRSPKLLQFMIVYALPIILGIASGLSEIYVLHKTAHIISEIFIRIFTFLSIPLVSLAIIVTIAAYPLDDKIKSLSAKTFQYTLTTTIIAAAIACILYILIPPKLPDNSLVQIMKLTGNKEGFLSHLANIIPVNIFAPFLEHRVISVLIMAIGFGIAARQIKNLESQRIIVAFFQGWYDIFVIISGWISKIIPIALYSFITTSLIEFNHGHDLAGVMDYLLIILLANLIQGLVILPLWLKWNNISPIEVASSMMPVLMIAFFSKSSSATLPMTIEYTQNRLGVSTRVAQLVLPLCTTINMNGCAAFIFTTVTYVTQANGIYVDYMTMAGLVLIATIAAIGNAGVPMGCFLLSTSLLTAQGVPVALMGIILPFYAIIDMLETMLNVWSDICVTKTIDNNKII